MTTTTQKTKVTFVYEVFQNGQSIGKTQVTVSNNRNAFTEVEEKLQKRYYDQIVKFNHAGKTASINS